MDYPIIKPYYEIKLNSFKLTFISPFWKLFMQK